MSTPSKEDFNQALSDVKKLTKKEKERPKKETPRGQKRQLTHNNSAKRTPLNGCDIETSDKIRTIVSARYGGFTLTEASRQAGTTINAANSLRRRYPEAFAEAEQHHLEEAIKQHQHNLWVINIALSDMGPRAVKTLDQVMRSKSSKPETKLKAALATLELLGNNKHAKTGDKEGDGGPIADNLRYISEHLKKISEKDSYVRDIDAECVEVVE